MKKLIAGFACMLTCQILMAQATETTGHPLFTMMPNYSIDKYTVLNRDFDRLKIIIPDKKNTAGYAEAFKEGVFEECGYTFNGDRSKAHPSWRY